MPAITLKKLPFSKLAILENNQMEISNMHSALANASTKKEFSICIQNMAAYFYADDHDNFWTQHNDLKLNLVLAIGQSSNYDFSSKNKILNLLNQALEQIRVDIQNCPT